MNADESTEGSDSCGSPSRKRRVDEELKQLQEKTGDLCETVDRIEKGLLEAAGLTRPPVNEDR